MLWESGDGLEKVPDYGWKILVVSVGWMDTFLRKKKKSKGIA